MKQAPTLLILFCLPKQQALAQCVAGFTFDINDGKVRFFAYASSASASHSCSYSDGTYSEALTAGTTQHFYKPGTYTINISFTTPRTGVKTPQ